MVIQHHGIKGQKWGVRRYQNPDGSLTPEGKRRYANLNETNARLTENAAVLEDIERYKKGGYSGRSVFEGRDLEKEFNDAVSNFKQIRDTMDKKYKFVQNGITEQKGKEFMTTLMQDTETGLMSLTSIQLHSQPYNKRR